MLDDSDLSVIKTVISKYLPSKSYQAFIFGSRVKGKNRKFSDVDLGIMGEKPLDPQKFMEIKFALDDSDLPYRVDLVDFSTISDKFKSNSLKSVINL